MDFIQILVALCAFFLVNIPVYSSLNYYFIRHKRRGIRWVIFFIYWLAAFFTENLVPFIGIILLILYVHRREVWYEPEPGKSWTWSAGYLELLGTAGLAVVFKFAITIVNLLYVAVLNYFTHYNVKPQEIVTEFSESQIAWRFVLFFIMVVFAPIVEEYVFRYYFYSKVLLPRMPALTAAVISAGLFTLLHYNIGGIPSFFGLGLFNTWLFEKKGYYAAVTSHVVFNAVTTAVLLLSPA